MANRARSCLDSMCRSVKGAPAARNAFILATAQIARAAQPAFVGVIGEQHLPLLERIDHLARYLWPQRGAAEAATEPSLRERLERIDVPGAMHHDRALSGQIVDAGFEPVHAQRITIAAVVGLGGAEQADA